MADDNSGLMAEFEEFLNQKKAKETEEAESEDFEIEIFDKEGNGVRTRRSHAKPFLQRMGIDVDPDPESEGDDDKKPTAKKTPPKGKTATGSVTRKYFTAKKV
jgi:hypothetical protein